MRTSSNDSGAITIVIATRNRKKGQEMLQLLAPPWDHHPLLDRMRMITLDELDEHSVPPIEEDAQTFEGNADKKASETARILQDWVIADDSGLAVDALGGAPGVYSARYSGPDATDEENNARLIAELSVIPADRRTGGYVCCLSLADPSGTIRLRSRGECRGLLLVQPRGSGGFGYDPLFLIPEWHKTFGELSPLVKSMLSHRARAFERLRPGIIHLAAEGAFTD